MKTIFIIVIAVVCSIGGTLGVLVGLEMYALQQAEEEYMKYQKYQMEVESLYADSSKDARACANRASDYQFGCMSEVKAEFNNGVMFLSQRYGFEDIAKEIVDVYYPSIYLEYSINTPSYNYYSYDEDIPDVAQYWQQRYQQEIVNSIRDRTEKQSEEPETLGDVLGYKSSQPKSNSGMNCPAGHYIVTYHLTESNLHEADKNKNGVYCKRHNTSAGIFGVFSDDY